VRSHTYNLFLDFGASYTKLVGINTVGNIILNRRVTAPKLNQSDVNANYKNYDPMEYARHAETAYNSVLTEFGRPMNVAISGQVATYVILDDKNQPLTPIVSWQDTSSLLFVSEENSTRISLNEAANVVLEDGVRPGLPALSIYSYLAKLANNSSRKKKYAPLTSFLLMKISRSSIPVDLIHSSEAHASGFYSLKKKSWLCTANFKECFPELSFPEVVHHPEFFFDATNKIKYWLPIGDQQAAVYGSNVSEDTCIIHIATGGQVIQYSNDLSVEPKNSLQTRPTLDGKGCLQTITHLPAGRIFNKVLQVLSEVTGESIDWDYLESLENDSMGNSLVEIDVQRMNTNQEYFPSLSVFSNSPNAFLAAFIAGFSTVYASKIDLLPNGKNSKIHYSGGLICKSRKLQHAINLKLPNQETSVSLVSDTSIAGLNKMINQGY
jgi:hypothetical protein